MPDGYNIDGRRLSGGSQQAFLQQKETEARRKKAALDLAAESSLPEDMEIFPALRTYNIHVRAIIDGHIAECIGLRDGSDGPNGQPGQEAYVTVVTRLQDIRIQLFGSAYEEPYEIVEDVILQTHQSILEDETDADDNETPEDEEDEEEAEEEPSLTAPSETAQLPPAPKLTNPPHGGSSVQSPNTQPVHVIRSKQKGRR